MSVTYFTTCSKKIWKISASKLVDSFIRTQSEGRVVVYLDGGLKSFESAFDVMPGEGGGQVEYRASPPVEFFLAENLGQIPTRLGGLNTESMDYWNRNMLNWFRKVECIYRHLLRAERGQQVWLDADVVFDQRVDQVDVDEWFGEAEVIYLHGGGKHAETGFLGFDQGDRGSMLAAGMVQGWREFYVGKSYRGLERWDDAWLWTQVVKGHNVNPPEMLRDIANGVGRFGEVFQHSRLRGMLTHNKGTHKRKKLR